MIVLSTPEGRIVNPETGQLDFIDGWCLDTSKKFAARKLKEGEIFCHKTSLPAKDVCVREGYMCMCGLDKK